MPAISLRAAAAALVLAFAGAAGASAEHRGGHPALHRDGAAAAMSRLHGEQRRMHRGDGMGRHHGMHHRQSMHHQGMHRGHGMDHGPAMHRRHHAMHHRDGARRFDRGGDRAFFAWPSRHDGYRPSRRFGYRVEQSERAFFPRPRHHRRVAYGWRQSYAPAYYPYSHGVSHGYGFRSYGVYPVTSYGVVSGGSVYAPLYNRPFGVPAFGCY